MSAAGPETILITGASRGIGRALALHHAAAARRARRRCRLYLTARDETALMRVAAECAAEGAVTDIFAGDVRGAAVSAWLEKTVCAAGLELAYLNAGISRGASTEGGMESAADIEDEMAVNFTAAARMGLTVARHMAREGRGRIVYISSLAALNPLPGWGGYCASKAALRAFAHSQRLQLKKRGIAVSAVLPGFVDTDLSRAIQGRKMAVWTAGRAAAAIAAGAAKGRAEILFPLPAALLSRLAAVLPRRVRDFFLLTYFTYRRKQP